MLAKKVTRSVKQWLTKEQGQTLVEYVLIISLFSITLIAGLTFLAGGVNTMMDNIVAVVEALV